MSKHTEEPWSVWTSNSHIRISARGDGDVVSAAIARDGMAVLSVSLEDAERIVSCVNACVGLSTENLVSVAGPLILATSMSQWLHYCDLKDSLAELLEALPKTADGLAIVPGITVYCIAGEHVDERTVIGPYGKLALLTTEPARHGAGTGQCHRLANSVYSTLEAAKAAIAKVEAA